jgi:hypothetical protein
MSPSIYLSLSCCVLALSVNFACQKKKEISPKEETTIAEQSFFNKYVGAPVDSATANRWKRNLKQTLSRKAPAVTSTTVFYLPATALRSLIGSDKAAGICFYYGTDSAGNVHLVPVAVDVRGYVMQTASLVTTNGTVSWEKAKKWRQDFKLQNPNGIWGHFWGSVAVERLLSKGTDTVRMELGLSDEGAQQIMFSNAAELAPTSYEDRTRSCPPFCPSDLE